MGERVSAYQRRRVLDVLPLVADWPLTMSGWEYVGGLLAWLEDALLRDDGPEVGRLASALEAASPSRIHVRVSAQRAEPPAPVRDRLNRLQETLAGPPLEDVREGSGDDAE
ncbi:CATRA system-associated protein [Actinocorallia sp. B10E7]|uniref:CATRA system-associated protein n=1 Tax=Actinocorallia sp. B10E7 TaxID=3153558 RepID=UPI00325CF0EA